MVSTTDSGAERASEGDGRPQRVAITAGSQRCDRAGNEGQHGPLHNQRCPTTLRLLPPAALEGDVTPLLRPCQVGTARGLTSDRGSHRRAGASARRRVA